MTDAAIERGAGKWKNKSTCRNGWVIGRRWDGDGDLRTHWSHWCVSATVYYSIHRTCNIIVLLNFVPIFPIKPSKYWARTNIIAIHLSWKILKIFVQMWGHRVQSGFRFGFWVWVWRCWRCLSRLYPLLVHVSRVPNEHFVGRTRKGRKKNRKESS